MTLSNEMKTGIFAVTTLAILVFVVLVMGKERRIFSDGHKYRVIFSDVKGLAAGAPVRLGGLTIGRVEKIGFSKDPLDTKVYTTLIIDDEFTDRVRVDSTASIETQGLLGDRFIILSPGTSPQALAYNGDIPPIERPDISEILSGVSKVVSNSSEITGKFKELTAGLKPETLAQFGRSAEAFAEVLEDVKQNKGVLFRLIYSEKEGDQVAKGITALSEAAAKLSDKAIAGPGLIHGLFYDPKGETLLPDLVAALDNIGESSRSIGEFVEMISQGRGPLSKLIVGPSDANTDVNKDFALGLKALRVTMENLERVSLALSQGSGSLGALLIDPRIYDALLELTENANRSVVLRQVVRSTLK